jgi:hypothetical protein
LARDSVRLAERTDFVSMFASALIDLAECRRLADDPEDPAVAERASALFEGKGDRVGASRARAFLETPRPAT